MVGPEAASFSEADFGFPNDEAAAGLSGYSACVEAVRGAGGGWGP